MGSQGKFHLVVLDCTKCLWELNALQKCTFTLNWSSAEFDQTSQSKFFSDQQQKIIQATPNTDRFVPPMEQNI